MTELTATSPATEAEPSPLEGQFVSFDGSPFQLYQPYPPAGDQPAAIDQLVEGLEEGLAYQTLLGVTGSGKTFTMANVIARAGRPAIVFAPNKTLAAQLYSEFREFFPRKLSSRIGLCDSLVLASKSGSEVMVRAQDDRMKHFWPNGISLRGRTAELETGAG